MSEPLLKVENLHAVVAEDGTEILRGLDGDERIAAANAFLLKAELAKGEAEHGH